MVCVLTFFCVSNCPQTLAQDNVLAQDLLARMSQSLRELNYRGRFTYEVADSALVTYQLTHQVVQGKEQEKLVRLNGTEREVVLTNGPTTCLAFGDKILRGVLEGIHPSDQLFSNYTLYLRGELRVAGRPAYLLQLVPHDSYRHGQSIAVDKESFLPLQKQWFSPDNKLMERMQFVDLELFSALEADDMMALKENAEALHAQASDCDQEQDDRAHSSWTLNWLPKGFFLTKVGRTEAGEASLFYTDGLASFSVFVREHPVSILVEGKTGTGATIAYVGNRVWQQSPFRITVVGEIPQLTAQKVIASIEPIAP